MKNSISTNTISVWGTWSFSALMVVLAFVVVSGTAASPAKDPNAVFPVEELKLLTNSGEFTFSVEIADTLETRQRGLMFREKMLLTHGMLFDFKQTASITMWMKNTPLSLDMVFIKPGGEIVGISKHTTPFSIETIPSPGPVSHVLELNAGVTTQIGLRPGDKVLHRFFD